MLGTFKELEIYEKLINLEDEFIIKSVNNSIHINTHKENSILRLGVNHLEELENGEKIKNINGLKYINHCGFTYDKYGEFFVTIKHPQYFYIDEYAQWPSEDSLKFPLVTF